MLVASGHSRVLLRFTVINTILAAVSILVGMQFSLEAAALAFSVIGLAVRTPMLFAFVTRHTSLTWRDLINDVGVFVATGLVLGIAGLSVRHTWLVAWQPRFEDALWIISVILPLWVLLLWWKGVLRTFVSLRPVAASR